MPKQEVPVYSQEEKRKIRLNVCKLCPFSQCNGNESNKCNVKDLVCVKDNDKNIVMKTSDLKEKCPLDKWNISNATKFIEVKGCGCGKK